LDHIGAERARGFHVAGAEFIEERLAGRLRHLERRDVDASLIRIASAAEAAAALGDRALEQSFCGRRSREHADGDATGRLAEDRHAAWIAAELRDVRLHPLQAGNLIL